MRERKNERVRNRKRRERERAPVQWGRSAAAPPPSWWRRRWWSDAVESRMSRQEVSHFSRVCLQVCKASSQGWAAKEVFHILSVQMAVLTSIVKHLTNSVSGVPSTISALNATSFRIQWMELISITVMLQLRLYSPEIRDSLWKSDDLFPMPSSPHHAGHPRPLGLTRWRCQLSPFSSFFLYPPAAAHASATETLLLLLPPNSKWIQRHTHIPSASDEDDLCKPRTLERRIR